MRTAEEYKALPKEYKTFTWVFIGFFILLIVHGFNLVPRNSPLGLITRALFECDGHQCGGDYDP